MTVDAIGPFNMTGDLAVALNAALATVPREGDDYAAVSATWHVKGAKITVTLSVGLPTDSADDEDDEP